MRKRLSIAVLALFILGVCTGLASAQNNGKADSKGNGHKFSVKNVDDTDMQGEWSREAVMEATALGYVSGDGNGMFRPNQPLTKLEAIVMLVKTKLGYDPADYDISDATTQVFQDDKILKKIPEWAKIYVEAAYQAGIILPDELKTFNPQQGIKRYEVCIYLSRINGDTDVVPQTKKDFKDLADVPEEYRALVQGAHNRGLVNGDQDKFFPNQIVKRCEMTVILGNLEDNVLHHFDSYTGTVTDVSKGEDGVYTITVDTDNKTIDINADGDTKVFSNGDEINIEDILNSQVRIIAQDDNAILVRVISKDANDESNYYKGTGTVTDISAPDGDGAYVLTVDTSTKDGVQIDADEDTVILSDGKKIDAADLLDLKVKITVQDNKAIQVVVISDDNN